MTIVPRNGRFGVKVWDQSGKRYRWVGSFTTEAEARLAEADALPRPTHSTPTVEQWGRIWLTDYAREAPATRQVYAQAVKSIASAIGRVRLDELDRPSARRLANAWPRNTSAVARTMWEDARRDGVCQENPWSNLRLRQSRGRKDIIALAEGEVQELADVAEMAHGEYGLEVRAMILVLAYTGVRPGELHVRRSLDVTGIEKLPKNGKQRVITVPPLALAAVSAMPRLLAADYIFHTVQGRRLSKSSLWYAWRPVRIAWRAAGHRDLDLYELRHAAATMLLERGVAHADVAVQLGHEDGGALVMSRYGHPSRDTARQRLKAAYRCEQQA